MKKDLFSGTFVEVLEDDIKAAKADLEEENKGINVLLIGLC